MQGRESKTGIGVLEEGRDVFGDYGNDGDGANLSTSPMAMDG